MPRVRSALVLGLLLLAGCASPGPLQLDGVKPGERVRATPRTGSSDSVIDATLRRQVEGSLEITRAADPTIYRIPILDLERLEVVRGRSRPRGALTTASLTALGGLLAGMVCRSACAESRGRTWAPLTGFALGASVGAVTGAILAPARWVEVRIH